MSTASFIVDAALFDMDGTLVDSIAAVEAAWGKVADELGLNREYVITATHGKRAIDNLKQFKPHLEDQDLPSEVQVFEESILAFADEHQNVLKHRSSFASVSSVPMSVTSSVISSRSGSIPSSSGSSVCSADNSHARQHDFGFGQSVFGMSPFPRLESVTFEELRIDEAWDLEDLVDRSIRILPGVRRMIDSIPEGRYCVATSGAKTYAYGAMSRVSITPPAVTITGDDPRLKAGKPAPDPFLLAAQCLGYPPERCVVFEDSPSGIHAGVASGAIVVALCTSHEREKIENCGAHYLIDNMEQIYCTPLEDGRLRFDITALCSSETASLPYPLSLS